MPGRQSTLSMRRHSTRRSTPPRSGRGGAPVRLDLNLSGVTDDDPSLTADLLELYFASNRTGTLGDEDLWVVQRATTAMPWSVPVPVTGISSTVVDSNVEVSRDGLTLSFTSNRGGNFDLWISIRASRAVLWSSPVLAVSLSSNSGEWGVVIADDRLRAVLCSDRAGDEKLYESVRSTAAAAWSAPVEISALDSVASDCDGAVFDIDTMYFSSDRVGGLGNIDLWAGSTTTTRFDTIENLGVLNSSARDSDPWISPDHRTLYFSSNRMGSDDLYLSTR